MKVYISGPMTDLLDEWEKSKGAWLESLIALGLEVVE